MITIIRSIIMCQASLLTPSTSGHLQSFNIHCLYLGVFTVSAQILVNKANTKCLLCARTLGRGRWKYIWSLLSKSWQFNVRIWFLKIKWWKLKLVLVYVVQAKHNAPSKTAHGSKVASCCHKNPSHALGAKHPIPTAPFSTDCRVGKGCTGLLFSSVF